MSHTTTNSSEKLINVDMSKMTVIFMAPEYLSELFREAAIKNDFVEQQRIFEQMQIEVAKGNVRPDPPMALIELLESMKNSQFKVNTDTDEHGEEHVRIEISDKDYVPVEGVETCSLVMCGVTDVRDIDEEKGTATVGYDSSTGDKFMTIPIERVFSSQNKVHSLENC